MIGPQTLKLRLALRSLFTVASPHDDLSVFQTLSKVYLGCRQAYVALL